MSGLVLSVSAFVVLHWLLSALPVRDRLVARLGERRFSGLYSLAVGVPFVAIFVAWGDAPYIAWYAPPAWTRWIPVIVAPVAFVLMVAGFTTQSPTATGAGQVLESGSPARGVVRLVRHPALTGIALLTASHLTVNGDARSVVLFGGMTLLSVVGMVHIDHRRARARPSAWPRFAAQTSRVPLLAVLQGRQRVVFSEIGWGRVGAGLALAAVAAAVHPWLIGPSPWP